MRPMHKKGVFEQLASLGVGVASLVILLAVAFLVMSQTGAQAAVLEGSGNNLTACTSQACNSTRVLITATGTIPGWVPLIILVAIGGLILGLVAVFGGKR